MTQHIMRNDLRRHRKQSGLSQRDIGALLGYRHPWQVSRHEKSETLPPLLAALAYQALFQVPVSAIFVGLHESVERAIEQRLAVFQSNLASGGAGRASRMTAQKEKWLKARRA